MLPWLSVPVLLMLLTRDGLMESWRRTAAHSVGLHVPVRLWSQARQGRLKTATFEYVILTRSSFAAPDLGYMTLLAGRDVQCAAPAPGDPSAVQK